MGSAELSQLPPGGGRANRPTPRRGKLDLCHRSERGWRAVASETGASLGWTAELESVSVDDFASTSCIVGLVRFEQSDACLRYTHGGARPTMVRLRKYIPICLLLAGGCGDQASERSDGSGELTCQAADEVLGSRIYSGSGLPFAQFRGCSADADCVAWQPVLECSERDARLSQCITAISRVEMARAHEWLQEQGEDVCANIERGCRGSGDCAGGELRCVSGSCVLQAADGGLR